MKGFYSLFCVLGLVAPYSQFVPWAMEYGIAPIELARQAFSSHASGFAWMDVIVSALVLIGFIVAEGRRSRMGCTWAPIAGTLLVGVSFGLPLFLLMRELHMEKE